MEFTFEYDVEAIKTEVLIASVTFREELTEDQTARLRSSFRSGKYAGLDEDENIADIYKKIYDIAIQAERQEDYGDLLGTEVAVTGFRYPAELRS